jgi:hypothetical protein
VGARSLVVAQVAISLVLLVGTGLFIRTLRNLQDVDPGFNAQRLALFQIRAHTAGYAPEQFDTVHTRIQERLATLPGARGHVLERPPARGRAQQPPDVRGRRRAHGRTATRLQHERGGSNFLAAMEIPLLLGRPFGARCRGGAAGRDRQRGVPAPGLRGGESHRPALAFGSTPMGGGEDVEIVGLARDAKYTSLASPHPRRCTCPRRSSRGRRGELLRPRRRQSRGPVRRHPRRRTRDRSDPGRDRSAHTDEQIARMSGREILFARLSGFFGVVALALAGRGPLRPDRLHGGAPHCRVRRADGAGALPRQVLSLVLGESLALVTAGIALGLAIAYGASGVVTTRCCSACPRPTPSRTRRSR